MSEIALLFGANMRPAFDWPALMWPGRMGLVVLTREGERSIERMRWGLSMPKSGLDGDRERTVAVAHDLLGPLGYRNPSDPPGRCLIICESFACAEGPVGRRTRTWFGLSDAPLFAWAGLWRSRCQKPGYVGLMTMANELVDPVAAAMPVILDTPAQEAWLNGSIGDAMRLRRAFPAAAMYRERTEEPWRGDMSAA